MSKDMFKREYSLDLLKFLSIILIIFHHYQQTFNVFFENGINFYNGSFYFGYIVELFFILSGFFTCKNIENIKNIKINSFFMKKYLRFFPLVFISGFTYLIFEICYTYITQTNFNYSLFTVVTSLLGITRCFSENIMINNPIWYISVLLLCYILFFLITKFAEKYKINKTLLYTCVVICALVLRFFLIKNKISLPLVSDHIMRGYVSFFYGLIVTHLLQNDKVQTSKVFLIIFAIVCLLPIVFFKQISNIIYLPLIFIIYPCLIAFFQHFLLVKILNKEMFSQLGSISFNAFIWHGVILKLMEILNIFLKIPINSYITMFVVLMIILLFGCLSSKYIEIPISEYLKNINIKKREV